MSTLRATFTPHIASTRLELGIPSLSSDDPELARASKYSVDSTGPLLTAPKATLVQFHVKGFTDASGQAYVITAASRIESSAWQAWPREGSGALSPELDHEGPLELKVDALPGGATQGATTTTVTIRINKGGKPDDFLQQFVPG